jgi:hypothetical protein
MASSVEPLGTSVVVPLPDVFGGLRANDLVIVFVYAMWNADFDTTDPIEAPLGWTAIDNASVDYSGVAAGMGDRLGAWYFPVVADGVGPSDLEFTWLNEAAFVARAVVYRNVNAAAPILNQPMQVGVAGDPAAVDVSVATTLPGTRIVVAMAARSGAADTAFNLTDDTAVPVFNRRSQSLTNDQLSPQGGGFESFGSYPDQGSPDVLNGDYGSLTVADRVYSIASTPVISGEITAGPVTGADTQAMGIAIRLNEAS